ncbi:MAG: efflux RND transporter periplasmic adaptor subunit, partial [Burkholderiaceae bacterium]|nr:efflux RND transporter periplasmic adaptor subunit [Burkholderiaceae bacterium]
MTKPPSFIARIKQTITAWGRQLISRLQKIDLKQFVAFLIKRKWWLIAIVVLVYAGNKAYDHFFPAESKRGGPQTVVTLVLEKQDIPIIIESTGTVVAANIVDVRPQVSNVVDRNDRANYDKAKAVADDAQRQLQRAKELVAQNFISKAGLDTAEANAKSAAASARAAEVQLSFDYIRAPIDGRAGIINVFPGSLVAPGNIVTTASSSTATTALGAMVTITQLDPINVQFIVGEDSIPLLMQSDPNSLKVAVSVGDQQTQTFEGKVLVIDNQVDPAIGAVRVKAQIANDKRLLLPGQFARVKLEANTLKDAILVPSQAVVINPRGRFIYVVGAEDKVSLKPIKVSYEYQGKAASAIAYTRIPVAALPSFNTPVISVSASLPGASPENMASSVALPLEKEFSTIDGITVISSTNFLGTTNITLEFNNDRDIDKAAVDVQAALLRAQRRLPIEMTVPPSYRKVNPADAPVLIIGMTSPSMDLSELNDYAENLISPTLSTIDGVAQIIVYGIKRYAIRVQARPDSLATHNLTMEDLSIAINKANSNTPVGVLEGPRQLLTIYANKQLVSAADFANLVVAQKNGLPIYLRDVAEVVESYENVRTLSTTNGERSIALAIQRQPNANTVKVVDAVKAMIPEFEKQLPASIKLTLINDRSLSIREAIHDVNLTLGLTVALVVLVIFLFLKHISATVIPSLSLPISLIGAFFLLYFMGYSLDNVSLLGITLAVGLVVDDSIVVLENIVRYVDQGMSPLKAALKGSREVGFTILSISLSLVAVFIPIFFMEGPIGLLFREFAVVVSLAIVVSAVVSLTLVPMLCSRYLPKPGQHAREFAINRHFDRWFEWTQKTYVHYLDIALQKRKQVLWLAVATFVITIAMFVYTPKGFFPEEDIGQITATTEADQDISFKAMLELQDRAAQIVANDPNVANFVSILGGGLSAGSNTGRFFIVL